MKKSVRMEVYLARKSAKSAICDAVEHAAGLLGYSSVKFNVARWMGGGLADQHDKEEAYIFGYGLHHVQACLAALFEHRPKLSLEDFAAIEFALAYAWAFKKRTESANLAMEQVNHILRGSRPEFGSEVYRLVLVVRGKVTAVTHIEQIIAQIGLEARNTEDRRPAN